MLQFLGCGGNMGCGGCHELPGKRFCMTGEAHRFSKLESSAHPSPMLLETGFDIQMAGFATQQLKQHEWLDRRFCTTVVHRRFCPPVLLEKGFALQLAGFATQQMMQHKLLDCRFCNTARDSLSYCCDWSTSDISKQAREQH